MGLLTSTLEAITKHDTICERREKGCMDLQSGKTDNGTSAWFIIYQSGEGRSTQMRKNIKNGGERVIYTQV